MDPSTFDTSRVKMLCSFNGSILPRPRDGKLRYVGGETRVMSAPRDIGFEELMARMKVLFEGAKILKYKQPDEDLDALVSVVNDDDVINMMEEYDKLGSSDGFARLRVFLLSNSEIDDPLHFLDAFKSLNGSPEFGKQPITEFGIMAPIDDVHFTEQYINQLNLEGGIRTPRNFEAHMPSINMHHLSIPHLDQSPRSPGYYSPRHPVNDYISPPSCSCCNAPYGETTDMIYDRSSAEDYFRQYQHHVNDHLISPADQNLVHGTNIYEGNNLCEQCSPPFGPFPHPFYVRDPNDSRTFYNEAPHAPLPYVHHDDRSQYTRHRHEFGNELIHDQTIGRYRNYPYAYGPENLPNLSSNAHVPTNSFWGDVQSPIYGSPSNEASINSRQQEIGTSNLYKNNLVDSSPHIVAGYNGVDVPDCYPIRPLKLIPNSYNLEDNNMPSESVQSNDPNLVTCSNPNESVSGFDQSSTSRGYKVLPLNIVNKETIQKANGTESLVNVEGKDGSRRKSLGGEPNVAPHTPKKEEPKVERLSYVPQIVESVKAVALESGEDVKINGAQKGVDSASEKAVEVKEEETHELDVMDAPTDLELDSDTGTESNSKIEQTKAEEEAIARGLQTIKNDDLEEIRQLGSGTYGAVYHGKWKGTDVAIKRIKASCFSGNETERQRMIADFWKEALLLSSLHHPNVVSFYGIVRDGPDGSLATVTEYMVNGSLKQFLKKKDRTIDRRKRLIIAMDSAFGMEYLHGRNIVHFDLKCENLLVNMRDPHRPICKIGDLGLSKVKQQTMVSGGVRGTLPWMAPELLSGKNHMVTEKIDVYSFGIVMWELLTGDEPYTNMHCASIIGGIVNNTLRPTIPTWCDPEWKSLMESCWSGDPQERPSFLEISRKLRTMAVAFNLK